MAGHAPGIKLNRGAGMMIQKKTLLSMAVGLALAGCGGGGGYQAPKTTSGFAVDGYLMNASVLCDTSENGVYDAGETVVLSSDVVGNKGAFTFPGGCAHTIVVSGGTDVDTGVQFKGLLKAPAGSTYVTPLTSLMTDTGLSAAQVATALGLPDGTDVTRIDPNSNLDLKKKTLALQQIVQQSASALASLDSNASPENVRAINSAVTKSIVATLLLNPNNNILISANGTVNTTLVAAAIIASVENVLDSNDPLLVTAKATLNSYNGNNIAELVSSAVVAQATVISKAGNLSDLVADVTSLQANPTIGKATKDLATLLLKVNDTAALNLTATGASLATLATTATDSTDHSNAGATLLAEIIVQSGNAGASGITPPTIIPATLSTITDYFYFMNDRVELNGASHTLAEFATGVTLAQQKTFESLGFSYGVDGVPIPVNAGIMTAGVRIGIELTDTTNKGQILQVIMDKAEITLNNAGKLSIAIPGGAQLHVYGRTSVASGSTVVTGTVGYTTADNFFVPDNINSKMTVNAKNMLIKLTQSNIKALEVLNDLKGKFNVRMVISNLSLRDDPSATTTRVNQLAVTVTGSNQPPVNGLGIQGIVTIQ